MLYQLPVGVTCAQDLVFSCPIKTSKNPARMRGMLIPGGPGQPGVLGFRGKKWGSGTNGDKNARWRKNRGLNKGQRSLKLIMAKVANAGPGGKNPASLKKAA